MPFVKLPRFEQVLPVEQKRILSSENSWTGRVTDEVSGRVAAYRGHVQNHAKEIDVEKSTSGNETRGDEKRISGKKKTDEQAGFCKYDRRHAEVARPLYKCRQVREIREELAQLIH